MALSPLCEICVQIPFLALRGPYPQELQDVRENKRPGEGVMLAGVDAEARGVKLSEQAGADRLFKINIGSLKQISSRVSSCDLCSIIRDTIVRQGAVYDDGVSLWDDNIVFRADPDTSYYEYILDSRLGSRQNTPLVTRRLCITAHPSDDRDGSTLAYFEDILQPCQLNSGQKSVSEDTYLGTTEIASVGKLFSGRLRPLIIEPHLLRSWITDCEENHGIKCSSQAGSSILSYIRLVDTEKNAVVQLEQVNLRSIRYCTLSYVWGQSQPHVLTKKNVQQFQTHHALASLTLPQTTRDAIALTQLLQFRYIWIDALCIFQDDIDDQKVQIGAMGDIYGSGTLNIVAAAGKDCNAGLPGLRPDTRFERQRELVVHLADKEYPGLSLLTTLRSHVTDFGEFFVRGDDDLTNSVWFQRGWTLQERALSRRNLIFTREQVMWSCNSAYYCEETRYEDWEDLPNSASTKLHSSRFFNNAYKLGMFSSNYEEHRTDFLSVTGTKWHRFQVLVENFTARDFTYSGDVYDGCSAILNTMGLQIGEIFLWGMPRSRLELGLAWDTGHGLRRRTAKSKLPMTSLNCRIVFPSWSWMGWEGRVVFSVNDDQLESDTPQVIAFTHHNKPFRVVPVRESNTSERGSTVESQEIDDNQKVNVEDVLESIPGLTKSKLALFADDYLLFFWTSSVFMTVHAPLPRSGKYLSKRGFAKEKRPKVTDSSGEEVGNVCKMFDEHWTNASSVGLQEFIMIGRRHIAELPEFPATILALQIERVDGVAYRVNYAEIEEAAWVAASPKRVLVALA